jgi:hypothetical protein
MMRRVIDPSSRPVGSLRGSAADAGECHAVLGCVESPGGDRSTPFGVDRLELRAHLIGRDVEPVLRLAVRLHDRDQVLLGAAGVEPAIALHLHDHPITSSAADTKQAVLAERWQNDDG